MWVNIIKTTEGKYVGQARISSHDGDYSQEHTVYETAEYVTPRMASADTKCWIAFHGKKATMEETEYTIDETDLVESALTEGGKPRRVMTGREFTQFLTARQLTQPAMSFRIATVGLNGYPFKNAGDFGICIKASTSGRETMWVVRKGANTID